ncbi:YjbE family putative metal transport protein [Rhodoferax sp. GW822-FHT02A01]|uniref:YjbE family putative metal transport protein n=1 Tax=Rhodoferax sp. GW822-FHT02A01 TaxID=3141537 RepID=UPI00315DA658
METDPSLLSFNVALGVLLVDILLSGDNAIVIALVCRSLSKEHRTKALWLGVMGAFVARLVLTSCATLAMNLPLIKLIGGLLLLKISIELIVDNLQQSGDGAGPQHSSAQDIFSAARTIVLADIVMSLDNVLALSAITQNNWQMLVAGLLLSIPILMFGSLYVARLMDVFPYLLWVGGAILGGVAGSLIMDDPVFGGAFSSASTLSNLVVPVIAAGFVVQISRVIATNAQRMQGVPKPPSLLSILWKSAPDAPRADAAVPQPVLALAVAAETAQHPVAKAAPVNAALATPPASTAKPVRPAPVAQGGEHRVLIALGLFMILSGGAAYYLLNVYQPAVPDRFITYLCKQPAMAISYLPHAREIRFATAKGAVSTTVIEDRVVWEDYRDAGARLGAPPPVKILSADERQLVVNGGVFENTSCIPAAQP